MKGAKGLKQVMFLGGMVVVLSLLLMGCCQNERSGGRDQVLQKNVMVQGDQFVDQQGRQVILNGINVVSKKQDEQYLFQAGPEFYRKLSEWGFNSIRFIIIWDGLEPEPGVYNESYLDEIEKRIQWAAQNKINVILDMHQDLFSVKYSDGAPEWATLDESKPHTTGAIWSDAYMMSEAVQTAFDNFWANKQAPDGVGLQDHYAQLWQHIAKRFSKHANVIGYDIMNEPFPGSSAMQAMPAMLTAYAGLVYQTTGKLMSEEELAQMWGHAESRMEALKMLSTRANYAPVIDALYQFNKHFEEVHLQTMYQKVSDAIRQVDDRTILFLEHSYFSNTGVRSSIKRTNLPDGTPDPLVAYAPHGYDLVTDTKDAASAKSERVEFIFDRIEEKGKELQMPVWMGEWGAYYSHSDAIVPVARHAVSLIERNLIGNAYWSYDPGTEKLGYFQKALWRPYPSNTTGQLLRYGFDHASRQFMMEWLEPEGATESTLIYVPRISKLATKEVGIKVEPIPGTDAGWVSVEPDKQAGKRKLVLQFEE
jgi:endoglycosylceramidase